MKANELQIGNLVFLGGQTVKVRSITRKKVGVLKDNVRTRLHYARLFEVEPIPITEEWLMKNGFIRICDKLDAYYTFYSREIDGHFIEVTFNNSNISFDHVVCHIDNPDRCSIANADILHIHQLQNLLNLVGVKSDFAV